MKSFYVSVMFALLQSFQSNRCLGLNAKDFTSMTTYQPNTQTSNSIITEEENVYNVTDTMTSQDGMMSQNTMTSSQDEMMSQHETMSPEGTTSQEGMTTQEAMTTQEGMTTQEAMTTQEGMTTQEAMTTQEGMTTQNETTQTMMTSQDNTSEYSATDVILNTTDEPSSTLVYASDVDSNYTVTEVYLEPVTTESKSWLTNLMTDHVETTDHVKSTPDTTMSSVTHVSLTSTPVDSTTLNIPVSTTISPSSTQAGPTLATSPKQTTVRPPGTIQAPKDFKFTMKMDGDCNEVTRDEYTFKQACVDAIVKRTRVDREQLKVDGITCGSIIVEFTFSDKTGDDKGSEMLEMASDEEPLIIRFKDVDYSVILVEPFEPKDTSEDDGLSIEDQRRLIYIIAGGILGFVIILAMCACLCQSCKNRCKKRDKDISFQTEHLTKLSDMNLTTTIIPRPKSIYANVGDYETRCSLFAITNNYYYYNNGAFMYDDETQPNGEVMSSDGEGGVVVAAEVNEPTTPGTKATEQFGMSSIPEWKLPQLEGVVRAGSEVDGSETASIHEFSRPSSRTFSVPFPPPPPPIAASNNQDPTVKDIILPVPQLNRQSDAFSELTDSSSGDTNVLLRGGPQRKEKEGVDNAGLQVDEDKSHGNNTLTRKAPGSELASYEALSRL